MRPDTSFPISVTMFLSGPRCVHVSLSWTSQAPASLYLFVCFIRLSVASFLWLACCKRKQANSTRSPAVLKNSNSISISSISLLLLNVQSLSLSLSLLLLVVIFRTNYNSNYNYLRHLEGWNGRTRKEEKEEEIGGDFGFAFGVLLVLYLVYSF